MRGWEMRNGECGLRNEEAEARSAELGARSTVANSTGHGVSGPHAAAQAATRDYVLTVESEAGAAPILNVLGGKITTYRRLAEAVMEKLRPFLPHYRAPWTAAAPLPGGDFAVGRGAAVVAQIRADYPFLSESHAGRLARSYGTRAHALLGEATAPEDLGRVFGADLTEREVRYLVEHEWARSAEDVLWRRSKLGLRFSAEEASALDSWMRAAVVPAGAAA